MKFYSSFDLKHQIWHWLGRYPNGLRLIDYYVKIKRLDISVSSNKTDLVIEGYPRSANTITVAAFRVANQNKINIAHHVHGSAQVLIASKYNIPCLVLLRNPMKAVVSLHIRNNKINIYQALRNYIEFYKDIYPLSDSFVAVDFYEIINGFDSVVKKVNDKYGCSFNPLGISVNNSAPVISEVKIMDLRDNPTRNGGEYTVGLPSKKRQSMADKLYLMIENDNVLSKMLDQANDIKNKILSKQ